MSDWRIGVGREKSWGPDNRWGAWMGTGVLQGLLDLLDQFLALPTDIRPRWDPHPAAIGCVPWITHAGIVDRLVHMSSCIVITKPDRSGNALRRLHKDGAMFPTSAVRGFEDYGPAGDQGRPMTVGPHNPWPPHDSHLGPVRVAGYRGTNPPLLHAKILVLGEVFWDEDEMLGERQLFTPRLVWWGSANWTHKAVQHNEVATFSDDPSLLDHATDFVCEAIKLSEPADSAHPVPTPEFRPVEYDDDEFHRYFEEVGWHHPDEDD